MAEKHKEDEFLWLFDRKPDKFFLPFANMKGYHLKPIARHPFLSNIWNNYSVSLFLSRSNPNVYFSPDGFYPISTHVPCIAVIHDIGHQRYPNHLRKRDFKQYSKAIPRLLKNAAEICTVSDFSRRELAEIYAVDPQIIHLTYNGARSHFQPLAESEKVQIRARYSGGNHYCIYLGSLHPRKNIPNLIKGFEMYCQSAEDKLHLIIVGQSRWMSKSSISAIQNSPFNSRIHHLGYMDDEITAQLLASAEMLILVSLYEGFGIPLIESMACRVPVICSNSTGLKEVSGNAAINVDPLAPEDLADAISELRNNTNRKNQLVSEGVERLQMYTWDKSADKVYALCRKYA